MEWIANRVKKQLDRRDDRDNLENTLNEFNDLRKSKWSNTLLSEIDFTDTAKDYKWQRGGIVWLDRVLECSIYPTPAKVIPSSLLNVIEKEQYNPVYYLSPNAAEGILRRVDGQNRTLFHPLRIALEKLSSRNI